MRYLTSLFPILLMAGPVRIAAQQPPAAAADQPPLIKAGVEEVVLDVVVRDKKGKPIKDLTAEEFTISDNGVKQKITSFRLVEGKEAISRGSTQTLDPMRQIRLVTLAFEGLSPDARRIAKQAALDLIKSDQGQNVYYSVFSIGTSLFPLQQFTTDRARLTKAIDLALSGQFLQFAAEAERVRSTVRESLQRASAAPQAPPPPPQPGQGQDNAGAGTAMGSQAVEQRLAQIMTDMMALDVNISMAEHTRMSIFGLLALVRGQASLPGRKTILYFSEGMWIPTHLDEPFRNIASTANRANVTFYTVDARGVQTWGQNSATAEQMQRAARASAEDVMRRDGGTTIDAIRASDNVENAMRNNVGLPLRTLAESTGGFLIGETNDIRGPARQVMEEVNSYYEITYNPGIENYDGSFRKTTVDLARKDTVLHARNGYFALPASVRGTALLPYEFALLKALNTNPLPKDIEYRSAAIRFQPTAAGVHGTLLVEVPMAGVTFTEDKTANTYKARVSVAALVKNQQGEIVQKFSRDLPLAGPVAQIPQVKGGNFIYKEQFDVAPGRYTVETAVMDHEAGKIAARKTAFVVTERKRGVALSNLSLVRNYQQNAKDLQLDDPYQYQGGRITPTLGGTVYSAKGAQLSMFFIVYPDASIPDQAQLTIEYLMDGATVAKGNVPLPAPDAQGRIPYVMSSPAEGMPPGTYQIKATVKQGDTTAEESTFVTVAAPK